MENDNLIIEMADEAQNEELLPMELIMEVPLEEWEKLSDEEKKELLKKYAEQND